MGGEELVEEGGKEVSAGGGGQEVLGLNSEELADLWGEKEKRGGCS